MFERQAYAGKILMVWAVAVARWLLFQPPKPALGRVAGLLLALAHFCQVD